MALKRLKWLKYLFIGRTEGETEQQYWNEKRKKHLANEHSAGIVAGLEVTETGPPSLRVRVAGGRAVDSDGNDPEVESVQELDLASLVPATGEVTTYIVLSFAEAQVEPYFVDETGEYQNKYLQDGARLEVLAAPPATPAVELARVVLAVGALEITDAANPDDPGPNEIDQSHRQHSGWTAPSLAELADVSGDEAAAFNAMDSPSAGNPVATVGNVEAAVSPLEVELAAARGDRASLDDRLDESLEPDGGLKPHGGAHVDPAADPVPHATPLAPGLMPVADKQKLDGIEDGAVAAGEVGDAHAAVTSGNPHGLDAADVGAAPSSHVGSGGAAHAAATGAAAGFMPAADRTKLDGVEAGATAAGAAGDAHATLVTGNPHGLDAADVGAAPAGHVGAGGAAHATATAALAGFMSAVDKSKLDSMDAAGKVSRVLEFTWAGDGTDDREIDLGDTYDLVMVWASGSFDPMTTHMAMAYAFGQYTYGLFRQDGASGRALHCVGAGADYYWQGRASTGPTLVRLGSMGSRPDGTNYVGRQYRALALKFSGMETLGL